MHFFFDVSNFREPISMKSCLLILPLSASFGQRYQSDPGTSSVLVTHQRIPSDRENSGDRDCLICADTKEEILFPRFSPTASCTHSPNTCLECLERSIRSDLNGKIWTDIRCPECRQLLDYTDIQRYADEETFKRYLLQFHIHRSPTMEHISSNAPD
jgi:hypothetical protein